MEFLVLPILIFYIYAVYVFSIKPHLAVVWILIISVVNAWFIEPPSVQMGLNIYLNDLVFVPIFLSALIRLIFKQEWRYVSVLWTGYGLIIFYGLYAGLKLYGTAAGVDFRNFFYYWSGTLYFMTFSYSKVILEKVAKYWLLICLALLSIVYFRFVAEFLHLPIASTWISADPTGVAYRVINSSQAYLLGAVVVMLFHRYVVPEAIKPSRVLTVVSIVAVIVLQHRSVWAATVLGISTLFLLPGIKKHKVVGKLAVIGTVGMVLLVPLVLAGYADNFIDSIAGSAERATHLNTGTFGSRMKAWERIMAYWGKLTFMDQFLGEPFGSGYAGSKTAPHNMFYHSLLRGGTLGTFFLLLFYSSILARLYFSLLSRQDNRFYPTLFFMLIIAQMAYYIPYSAQAEHGVILGIAASLVTRKIDAKQIEKKTVDSTYYLKPISNVNQAQERPT